MAFFLPILAGLGAKAIAAKYISSKILVSLVAFGAAAAVSYVQYRSAKKKLRAGIQTPPEGTTEISSTVRLLSSVSPSVWRIGEVRCGGYPVWMHQDDRDLYVVHVLGNGPMDSIRKLWVQGEEVVLTRSGNVLKAVGTYFNHLTVWEYFAADGNEGAEIRNIANKDMAWDDSYKLNGVSYCLVKLRQNTYGDDFDRRLFSSIPKIEYLVRGLKLQYPVSATTLSAPEYTTNAAKVIAWWLHERRGVDIANIDIGYLNAAIALCDEEITVSGSSEYPDSVKRYQFNGSINAGDDPSRVEEQMDLIIAGGVVEWDGKHYIRPGAEQTARLTITEDDIIDDPLVLTSPDWRDRFNSASATLQQSNLHDYLEHHVQIDDVAVEERDGMKLTRSDVNLTYINDPIQAYNIVNSLLLDARASLNLTLTCAPRDDLEIAKIIPGDKVKVTLGKLGLDDYEMRVLTNTIQPDLSVALELDEWPAGVYTDQIKLPKLTQRVIELDKQADRPDNLEVTSERITGEDGGVIWRFNSSWDDNGFRTELKLSGPGVLNGKVIVPADETTDNTLTANEHGTYTITARHFGKGYRGSLAVAVTSNAVREPLPAPIASGVEQSGSVLHIVLEAQARRDVAGMLIRYTKVAISSSAQPTEITEASWDSATELTTSSVVPSIGGTTKLRAMAPIPGTARYCFAARLVDSVGTLGGVTKLGIYVLRLPAQGSFNQQSWPLWAGTKNNTAVWDYDQDHPCMLMASPGTKTGISLADWKGGNGFPFGAPEGAGGAFSARGSSYYETKPLDCEDHSSSREVAIEPEYVTPATGSSAGTPVLSILYSDSETGTYTAVAYSGVNQAIPSSGRWVKARVWFDDSQNYKALERLSLSVNNV